MRPYLRLITTLLIAVAVSILGILFRPALVRLQGHHPFSHFTNPFSSNIPMARPSVVVVGSGLAGLSAAYEAVQAGATVRMLDRAAKPGGNSIKASSGINGAGTRFQQALGISKDELFYPDTVQSAGARFKQQQSQSPGLDRKELIETLTASSAAAVTWLADEIGVDLAVVAPLGGHSIARTHRGAGKTPPGADIVMRLLEKLKGFGPDSFKLESSAEVTALLRTDDADAHAGAVRGVRYVQDGNTVDVDGAVVFAAGGFAADTDGLLKKHRPDLAGFPSTNDHRPGAHGLLQEAGAALVDMDSVQIHPTGFVDPKDPESPYKFLAAEALRGEGAILLDTVSGKRFVNEMQTREHVSEAIMSTLAPMPASNSGSESDSSLRQWGVTMVLDPGASDAVAGHLGFYLFKGLLRKVKVRDLDARFVDAIDEYATMVAGGKGDSAFGRKNAGRWTLEAGEAGRDREVCAGMVTPVVHFTMGGAVIDSGARVLTREGKVVGGLWAAGEITGGVHGDNRLGGSSLLECVVFGRVAGRAAAGWRR